MLITQHGVKEKFYKGRTKHGGQKLVFFGWTKEHVFRKEKEWLRENMDRLNQLQVSRPKLRVIAGGKTA
jgi:hypothetical protein